jgi:hypothetical protein
VNGDGWKGFGTENSKKTFGEPGLGRRSLGMKRSFNKKDGDDDEGLASEYLKQIKKMAELTWGINYRHSAWSSE